MEPEQGPMRIDDLSLDRFTTMGWAKWVMVNIIYTEQLIKLPYIPLIENFFNDILNNFFIANKFAICFLMLCGFTNCTAVS